MTEPSSGLVKINNDGTVNVFTGTADIGGGQKTAMAMIAAEELGVSLDAVSVTSADTEVTTDTGGSSGSRQIMTGGWGVKAAATDAKKQLLDIAAKQLKADRGSLEIRDGRVFVSGSDKRVSLEELMAKVPGSIVGRGVANVPRGVVMHTFAAHFAAVEVDTRTGMTKVVKLIAAHDMGKAINVLATENQIEGGTIQGLGYALREEQIFDATTGLCINPNVLDYKMLTIKDIPEIRAVIVEPIDPNGPFGAKGVGEPPYSVPAPAVANAIHNAIGVRFKQLPITARVILDRLKELRA
jgi:xanthine dehydrogenase molybdenum-binding subunit